MGVIEGSLFSVRDTSAFNGCDAVNRLSVTGGTSRYGVVALWKGERGTAFLEQNNEAKLYDKQSNNTKWNGNFKKQVGLEQAIKLPQQIPHAKRRPLL